jgi:hypothetical protein
MSGHPENKRQCNEATRELKDQIKRFKEEIVQANLQSLATEDTDYSPWEANNTTNPTNKKNGSDLCQK